MGKFIQVLLNGIAVAAGLVIFSAAMIYLCIFHKKAVYDWFEGPW